MKPVGPNSEQVSSKACEQGRVWDVGRAWRVQLFKPWDWGFLLVPLLQGRHCVLPTEGMSAVFAGLYLWPELSPGGVWD